MLNQLETVVVPKGGEMNHSAQENVILPADELENLISDSESTSPKEELRTGFNYNKLYAVFCMAASALVSITIIAWFLAE